MHFSKIVLFIVLFVFFPKLVQAQTDLINTYINKCKQHSQNADSLFYYANLLININDDKAKAEGYFAKGYAHRNNMQLDSALVFFDQSSTYIEQDNYTEASRVARLASMTAVQAGKLDRAFEYIDQLKYFALKAEDSLGYATALNHEGVIYKNRGNLNKAIEKFTAAGKIQDNQNSRQTLYTYTNIAIAYTENNRDSIALNWFHKAYDVAHRFKDSIGIIKSINNLGNFYKVQRLSDSSLFYFEKLIDIEQKLPIDQRSLLYQNLADLNNDIGDVDKALLYYNKAEPFVRKGQHLRKKIELLSVLIRIEKKRQNNETALQLTDSLIAMIKTSNIPNKLLPAYLDKTELLKNEKNFEEAVKTLDIYNRVKDSLSTMQDAVAIQEIVSEYQLAEKELELKASLEGGFFKKNSILLSFLLLAITLSVFYFLYLRRKNNTVAPLSKQITLKNKHVLNSDDILFIKSDGHYLEYHTSTSEQPILERNRLKNALELLNECGFIQVHRSHIVNTSKISVVYASSLQLFNGVEIPISRSFKQKLKEDNHPLFQ